MKINIDGDAFRLLQHFIYYSKKDPEAMAEVMDYDVEGFKQRLRGLEKALEDA